MGSRCGPRVGGSAVFSTPLSTSLSTLLSTLLSIALTCGPGIAQEIPESAGEAAFRDSCAICHEPAQAGAPTMESMAAMPRDRILESMVTGIMRSQSAGMSLVEKERIADYLAGDSAAQAAVDRSSWQCAEPLADLGSTRWSRWGVNPGNQRYVGDESHSFRRTTVPTLRLDWAFGFPDSVRARSQPAVTEHVLFLGSEDGTVFALDRDSGCVHWTFRAASEVRSGISILDNEEGYPETLFFGASTVRSTRSARAPANGSGVAT